MLEQVLGRLESEDRAAGNAVLFDRLKEFLVGEHGLPTQAEIARELGMTENAVKQAFHRFRQRYRLLLREEIAHTVAQAGNVEDELRHLVSVLRTAKANHEWTRIGTNSFAPKAFGALECAVCHGTDSPWRT